jgi:hypothetical protein
VEHVVPLVRQPADASQTHGAWTRRRACRRDPREISRSGCLLVEVDAAAVTRPRDRDIEAIPAASLGEALRGMAEAGADEAILVVRPITEASIRELGAVLA